MKGSGSRKAHRFHRASAVGVLVAVVALASCGNDIEDAPDWTERQTTWTAEQGLRHHGGDGSETNWVHEAQIEANNKLNTVGFNTHRAGDGYACQRVVIRVRESHPMLAIAAEHMVIQLSTIPGVQEIIVHPSSATPTPGERQPDLEATLNLVGQVSKKLSKDGIDIEATIECHATSGHHRFKFGPREPVIPWSQDYTVKHTSRTHIMRTEGASAPEFRLAGKGVGEQVGKALARYVQDLSDEHGLPPSMPPSLRATYAPTPSLPWPEAFEKTLLRSYVGAHHANLTSWAVTSAGTKESVFRTMASAMQAEGWVLGFDEAHGIRMSRATSEGFALNVLGSSSEAVWHRESGEDAADVTRYIATYARTTSEDLPAQLAALDFSTADLAWVFLHVHLLEQDGKQRLLAALMERPPGNWRGWLQVARLQRRLKPTADVSGTMKRAAALAWLMDDLDALKKTWETEAGTLGLPESAPESLTFDELVEAGAIHLQKESPVERTIGVGEALLVVAGEPTLPHVTLLRIDRRPSRKTGLLEPALFRLDRHGGTSMSGYRGPPTGIAHPPSLHGSSIAAKFTADPESKNRYRVKLSLGK